MSLTADRRNHVALCRAEVDGEIHVFLWPSRGVERARFFLDGEFQRKDRRAPWDLVGGSRTEALPLDTTELAPGRHVVLVRFRTESGAARAAKATFRVSSGEGDPDPPPTDCDGSTVEPGQGTLEEAAEDEPAGTTFCLQAGTYVIGSSVLAQDEDAFIGRGRSSTFLVGDGTVQNLFVGTSGAHFIVGSLDISGAVGGEACAPDCGRAFKPSSGITLRDVRCHDNENQCIGGGGGDTLVVSSEIDHNGLDPAFHGLSAAGIKRVSGDVTIRSSFIHHNGGNGVWCDLCDSGLLLVEDSMITENARKGINYEISGGHDDEDGAVIRDNIIQDNNTDDLTTAGGIAIVSSQDVEIYGNTFGGNSDGSGGFRAILIIQDDRGFDVENVSIHDNTLNGDEIEGCDLPGVSCSD